MFHNSAFSTWFKTWYNAVYEVTDTRHNRIPHHHRTLPACRRVATRFMLRAAPHQA